MGTATSLYPVGSSKTSSDIPADLAKPGQRYRLRVILALLPLFLFLFIYIAILAGSIAVLYYAVTFPAPQLGHSDNLARCLTVGIRIGLLTFSVMLSSGASGAGEHGVCA
jgi:hypothetical protein